MILIPNQMGMAKGDTITYAKCVNPKIIKLKINK
jgi:hypothetical protein